MSESIKVYNTDNTPDLRKILTDAIQKVFTVENKYNFDAYDLFFTFLEDEDYSESYDCFWSYDGECYIINRNTGEYINWYKEQHIGRDAHMTVDPNKLEEFLTNFKNSSSRFNNWAQTEVFDIYALPTTVVENSN